MNKMIGFGELVREQRERVRAMFHVGDHWDYVYEVDPHGDVLCRRYEPMREYQAMSNEGAVITAVRARSEEQAARMIENRLEELKAALSFGHEYQAKWEASGRAIVPV